MATLRRQPHGLLKNFNVNIIVAFSAFFREKKKVHVFSQREVDNNCVDCNRKQKYFFLSKRIQVSNKKTTPPKKTFDPLKMNKSRFAQGEQWTLLT